MSIQISIPMNQSNNDMSFLKILDSVNQYYTDKIVTYGATARGVDWNSEESQILRFKQLLKVCNHDDNFSLIDYGCGYGALLSFIISENYRCKYFGYDICDSMIKSAKLLYENSRNAFFFNEKSSLQIADFSLASGVFNVKQEINVQDWENYIFKTLKELSLLSIRGFAFNMLTQYSDFDKMRSYLYYADPCFFFDFCKKHFSKNVALLHDYDLYEFTIIVRK
ncbi:class I SAM-dependent methyltransferase [Spirulina subsalsa FACHB-351]|uniref:Class I SAM-dependent methyltransferase n=1 Tax=Spirulina subsalsa FACHB-351 TaxID=234711 RepID=A0ABT3LAH5_9CYAN|nr:class I SAM-dependent methyltransferase [Spirulina subsalsa]MCW6038513.1 class I SAM-dependent methyltransferase [Spirulina subsalsa FACHB-351]